MEKQIYLSPSPHLHSGESTQRVMLDVIIALIPASVMSVVYFGIPALLVLLYCTVGCVVAEYACNRIMGKASTVNDYSAALTGILLALNLPPTSPWWLCLVGAFVAIVLAKQLFGGLGYNPFNPALVARVFLLISFPVEMTAWKAPKFIYSAADAVSSATPLGEIGEALMKTGKLPATMQTGSMFDFFIGHQAGSMGEMSALALLIGAAYLLYRKVITWHIPAGFVGAAFVLAGILWAYDSTVFASPMFHLLTGGLILGAFFMATDMVTSPLSAKGMLIFGAGCGILTILIRVFGSFPEGVSFAILLMNAAVPLIDRFTLPKVFGVGVQKA